MTQMVQVAVTGDITEAEELRDILSAAGIDSVVEPAVEQHGSATGDAPQKILVPERSLQAAQDAIESLTESDELVSDV